MSAKISSWLIFIILAITFSGYAQEDFVLNGVDCDQLLKFDPSNNDVFLLTREIYCKGKRDTCYSKYFLNAYSVTDGTLLYKISLDSSIRFINSATFSHDYKSFIVLSSNKALESDGFLKIIKYSMIEKKILWQKQIGLKSIGLSITFSSDDSRIYCVTTNDLITLKNENGAVINTSDLSSVLSDYNWEYFKCSISNNGNYFAFWNREYLTFSYYDEGGCCVIADYLWYGLRWILSLGTLSNYVFVWDVNAKNIVAKIPIDFESYHGAVTFTNDEQNLIIGPIDNEIQEYSIKKNEVVRRFYQPDSIRNENDRGIFQKEVAVISPNNNFIAYFQNDNEIILIDYQTNKVIKRFEDANNTFPMINYSMAFSPDSRFFGVVTKGNIIEIYYTKSWKLIWEKKVFPYSK